MIVYNDLDNHIVELLQYFRRNDAEKLLQDIDELILKFELSKENRQGYNLIRDYCNEEIQKRISKAIDNPELLEVK